VTGRIAYIEKSVKVLLPIISFLWDQISAKERTLMEVRRRWARGPPVFDAGTGALELGLSVVE